MNLNCFRAIFGVILIKSCPRSGLIRAGGGFFRVFMCHCFGEGKKMINQTRKPTADGRNNHNAAPKEEFLNCILVLCDRRRPRRQRVFVFRKFIKPARTRTLARLCGAIRRGETWNLWSCPSHCWRICRPTRFYRLNCLSFSHFPPRY